MNSADAVQKLGVIDNIDRAQPASPADVGTFFLSEIDLAHCYALCSSSASPVACANALENSMARKQLIKTHSYSEARRLAPWAVTMAWDPIARGFVAWEDYLQARLDIRSSRQGDLFVTDADVDVTSDQATGHALRAYLGLNAIDAASRAKVWTKRGFVATFLDPSGKVLWRLHPPTEPQGGPVASIYAGFQVVV